MPRQNTRIESSETDLPAANCLSLTGADVQATGAWHEPEHSCHTLFELGLGFATKKETSHETASSVL